MEPLLPARPTLEAVLALEEISEVDHKVLRHRQAAIAIAKTSPPVPRGERAVNELMHRVNENVGFGTYGWPALPSPRRTTAISMPSRCLHARERR